MDKGAFVYRNNAWAVDPLKIRGAVRDLAHDLLMIEATGDYAGAKKMLETLSVLRPAVESTIAGLKNVPVDINPAFTTAEELAPAPRR